MSNITESQGENSAHDRDPNVVDMLNEHFFFNRESIPATQTESEIEKPEYEEIQEWFERGEEDIRVFTLHTHKGEQEVSQIPLSNEDLIAILNLPKERGMKFMPQFSEIVKSPLDFGRMQEIPNFHIMEDRPLSQKEGEKRKWGEEPGVWRAEAVYFHPISSEKMKFQYSFSKIDKTAKLKVTCMR
jgi:hypothetical protein